MRNYRTAFLFVLTAAILLAVGLGYLTWKTYGHHRGRSADPRPGSARSSGPGTASGAKNRTPASALETPMATGAQPPLAPFQLSPQRIQSIGVKTGFVQYQNVDNDIRTVGNVAVDERLEASVQLRFAGWIDKVYVNSTYQFVRKGEPLFTIYSPQLVSSEREYLLARSNRRLLAASTIPGVPSGAASLLAASVARLEQFGLPDQEIERLERTGKVSQELTFNSPVSGYVTERYALPQAYVQPGTKLYAITGLSPVWVYADIFQNEIGQVRVGDPATVTVDSYPGREFRGRVDFIWPQVDPTTRTVKVRLVFANPGLKLMPGMFVNVSLNIPLGRHLVIPASGIFETGTRNIVFVVEGQGQFEPRNVELGARAGDEFIVLKGLKGGQRIVTSANFLIDSESQLQAALGSFMPPPPGAGAAAAMQAAQARANIAFTTSPSPLRKGSNTFRVRLTGREGKPVAGAKVTVTFYMPAMPAMGMSALRTVVMLSDKGGGWYEGRGNLASGGDWQVTITAQKGGETVAAKQLSVSAGGGM
ncbi:MAG: FixH family protein [Terriglobia bacterium]